jgi:hypothetical protein
LALHAESDEGESPSLRLAVFRLQSKQAMTGTRRSKR